MKMHTIGRGVFSALAVAVVGCSGPNLDDPAIVYKCVSDADCADGQTCDIPTGVCGAAEGEGEGCDADTDCDAGFFCDEGGACVDLAPLSTAPGVSATSIAIGLSAALTAGPREEGAAFAEGVRAAFKIANDAGGIKHRALDLTALNDGADPATATTNAATLTTGATPSFVLMAAASQTVAPLEAAATTAQRVLITSRAGAAGVHAAFNRFHFATRPSSEAEVEQAVNYFLSERDLRVPLQNFAILVEGSSDAADATPTAFSEDIRDLVDASLNDRVTPPALIEPVVFTYRANSLDVDAAVEATIQFVAEGDVRSNEIGARPVVIVLAGTGRSTAKYVEEVLNAFHELVLGVANPAAFGIDDNGITRLQLVGDLLFWAPAETGFDTLAGQTSELGTYDSVGGDQAYCSRLLSTQAVPEASPANAAAAYVSALAASNSSSVPSRAGLEGFIAAQVLVEGLKAAPAELTTDALIAALEGLAPVDFGGGPIDFSSSSHVGQAPATILEGVGLDGTCAPELIDIDITPQPPPQAQGCPVGVRLNDVDDICVIQGQLLDNVTLTNDFEYLLKGVVFVGDGAQDITMTIEPGTVLKGDFETTGTLVITRNANLLADGVHQEGGGDETCTVVGDCAVAGARCIDGLCASPIVLTSEKPVGQRATGDWGGLAINGRAPMNCTLNSSFNAVEGTTSVSGACQGVGEGGSGLYGGNDPNDDSGVLRFLRIEFAGKRIQDGTTGLENELNGIAFQAVGRGTTVDYIHIHRGQDDGIEFFGGTVDVKHILVTCADDDSFDWTGGFSGRAQFVVTQHCGGIGDTGIEADGREGFAAIGSNATNGNGEQLAHVLSPRSRPIIANMTAIGLNDAAATGKSTFGFLIRRGTQVTIANSVFTGFNRKCADIDDTATFNNAGTFVDGDADGIPDALTPSVDGSGNKLVDLSGTILSCSGGNFEAENAADGARTTLTFTSAPGTEQPAFTPAGLLTNAFLGVDNGSTARFTPVQGSPLRTGAQVFPDPYGNDFFEVVTYRGGVDPASDWTVGWTDFPAN